jgi:UDP-glucose 4-epimerase
MVVMVTGGSGFIGSHVVEALLRRGYNVRVLDVTPPQIKEAEWHKCDLLSGEEIQDGMRDVELVFHLGAIADVNVAVTDPERCLKVNEIGTLNLLRACTGVDVDRIVLASTVWVYGRTPGVVTESTPIPPPVDIYTKTKIGQEHLVQAWSESLSLPYTILRYDIPYGPRMRSNMAIANFVRKAMRDEPVTMFGDGKQGRCWIYVEDLGEVNALGVDEKAKNQIINVAGREFVTISQIIEMISRKIKPIRVDQQTERTGDFVGVRTNIEKARSILGWVPKTSFEDGLQKYIDYVQSRPIQP